MSFFLIAEFLSWRVSRSFLTTNGMPRLGLVNALGNGSRQEAVFNVKVVMTAMLRRLVQQVAHLAGTINLARKIQLTILVTPLGQRLHDVFNACHG